MSSRASFIHRTSLSGINIPPGESVFHFISGGKLTIVSGHHPILNGGNLLFLLPQIIPHGLGHEPRKGMLCGFGIEYLIEL